MLIFSIDMYHEVLPIIRGSRYVFKKPLFTKRDFKIPYRGFKNIKEGLTD